MASDKPNFLLVMSDEHGPMWSGTYGHPLVRTPNMDRLAEQGTTFGNAYANSPLCAPARAAFLTGRFVSTVGAWDNTVPLASDLVTWPYLLRSRGYEPVLAGKMHLRGYDELHGFERQLFYDITRTRRKTREVQSWRLPYPAADGPYEGPIVAGSGGGQSTAFDDLVEMSAMEFLRDSARGERPFALCVGFYAPHPPFMVPEPYFSSYYPDRVDLPNLPPGHLDNLPPAARRTRSFYGFDYGYTDDVIMRARAAYFGMVTYMDEKLGRLMDELERLGLRENTVVIYTSDHGDMLGEHGLWSKGSFYEQSARVPLQISWPGVLPEGKAIPQNVSLIDLTATILELAGISASDWRFEGNSLVPLMTGGGSEWPDEIFAEYFAHGTDRPQALVREGQWKLSYGHGDPPEIELYNLESDPGEFENLAGVLEHSDIEQDLIRRILSRWGDADALREKIADSQDERALIRQVSTPESRPF